MNRAALRALGRALRGRPYRGRRRRPRDAMSRQDQARQDEAWIGELLERTPPAEVRPPAPWRPRVTRYVRLACPQPDDTLVSLPPVPAALVLDQMAAVSFWGPR